MKTRILMLSGLVSLVMASAIVSAEQNYDAVWTNPDGVIVRNSDGECVRNHLRSSGPVEACGDPMPVAETTEEPVVEESKELSARALFGFDRSVLTAEGQAAIDAAVAEVGSDWVITAVRVVGHTDQIGTQAYNQNLSEERAAAVANYLEAQPGMANVSITAIGRGMSDPVVQCDSDLSRDALIECLAPNRRATLVMELEPAN